MKKFLRNCDYRNPINFLEIKNFNMSKIAFLYNIK